MDKERDMLQKILDGEAGEDEKQAVTQDLKKELEGLERAVGLLKQSERKEPPAFFTARVMNRLPVKKPSFVSRVREFLFGSRVLHWNVATAAGMAVIVLVAVLAAGRMHQEPTMTAKGSIEQAGTVRLTFYAPHARTVSVAGDFNKWTTDADRMKGADGMWSIDLKLQPGVYSYSFVVDGTSWVPDPGAQTYADDGFGERNAVLRVSI